MANTTVTSSNLLRFTSRGLFLFMLFVALILGWGTSLLRVDRYRRQQEQRVRYAEQELDRVRGELRDQVRGIRPDQDRSFWEAKLEGTNLKGMTISSGGNAFQRASFSACKLEQATLSGGAAAFQYAKFDNASVIYANLTGGGASFQGATFVEADLTGTVLTGGEHSFQQASFENAVLRGAKLKGSFQTVNLSVKLEGADLSAISVDDLASCYFKIPPSYDANTKFPLGFEPSQHLWKLAE